MIVVQETVFLVVESNIKKKKMYTCYSVGSVYVCTRAASPAVTLYRVYIHVYIHKIFDARVHVAFRTRMFFHMYACGVRQDFSRRNIRESVCYVTCVHNRGMHACMSVLTHMHADSLNPVHMLNEA